MAIYSTHVYYPFYPCARYCSSGCLEWPGCSASAAPRSAGSARAIRAGELGLASLLHQSRYGALLRLFSRAHLRRAGSREKASLVPGRCAAATFASGASAERVRLVWHLVDTFPLAWPDGESAVIPYQKRSLALSAGLLLTRNRLAALLRV